ncbi:MAG TPA: hypothetical protein VEC38_09245 [Candidatus Binataceae bacterium]|nr:hypothetical protein [Candidatus Binataceae bacterium]
MRSSILAVMVLVALSSGCASNQAQPASSGGAAASAAPAGGCEIDAMKICQAVRQQPVVQGGLELDQRAREQNSPATDWQTSWFPVANGHVLQVQCLINTQHSTVVHASVLKGPQLNDADIKFLRDNSLCKE